MDITEHIKLKAALTKNFYISPLDIDKMPMWEFEIYMKELNNMIKNENEKQQKEMNKYDMNKLSKMSNPNNMKNMQYNMNSNIPKITMPKI